MVEKGSSNTKLKRLNPYILLVSIALAFLVPLLFGFHANGYARYYGFPFDGFVSYSDGGYGFLGIGFILNIVFFYFVCVLLNKVFRIVMNNK